MLEKLTLLCVDDDKDTLEYLTQLLNDEVKTLYTATNGSEGFEKYKQFNPDIVLSDINMPKSNGIEMAKNIKSLNHEQPIIFFTAFDDKDILKEAIKIGISGFISKPLDDIKQLFEVLEKEATMLMKKEVIDLKNRSDIEEEKADLMLDLVRHITHHWKQPLNGISLAASILEYHHKQDDAKDERYINLTKMMMSNTTKLSDLLDSVSKLDPKNLSTEEIKQLISISNPLYTQDEKS